MIRATLAAVVLVALVCGTIADAQHSGFSLPSDARDDATPPVDTGFPWINPADGRVYHYHAWPTAALWLDEGEWISASRNAAAVSGQLKFGNNAIDFDTTAAAPEGYWFSDSTLISTITFISDPSVTPACTLVVNANRLLDGPASPPPVVWVVNNTGDDTTKVAKLLPDSCRVGFQIRAGGTLPTRPHVRMKVHRFVRP